MKLIQTNIGMRMSVMPGARRFTIVTKKLSAAASDAMPRIWRPMTQKSTLSPGEYCFAVRLAYPNHPALGAALSRKLTLRNRPPSRNTQ